MLNALIYKDGTERGSETPDDAPVFPGDIFPGDGGEDEVPKELLYARSGKLIYKEGFGISLFTKWIYDQSTGHNDGTDAYINGENKCWSPHSTSHVIDYYISKKNFSGRGSSVTMYVKMELREHSGGDYNFDGGASCKYWLWGGTSSYEQTEANHRAEKNGTVGGGATFKVTYDLDKDDYKIT